MKDYKYTLTTEDVTDSGYVVIGSDSLDAVINYAIMHTTERPLTHLVLKRHGKRMAIAVNGKFYRMMLNEELMQLNRSLDKADKVKGGEE